MKSTANYFDELDMFEIWVGNPIWKSKQSQLIIPVFNLGISEHPLNETEIIQRVDCSYLFFEGTTGSFKTLQDYNEKGEVVDIESNKDSEKETFILEGIDYLNRYYIQELRT